MYSAIADACRLTLGKFTMSISKIVGIAEPKVYCRRPLLTSSRYGSPRSETNMSSRCHVLPGLGRAVRAVSRRDERQQEPGETRVAVSWSDEHEHRMPAIARRCNLLKPRDAAVARLPRTTPCPRSFHSPLSMHIRQTIPQRCGRRPCPHCPFAAHIVSFPRSFARSRR
jgi:hypothetical protein